MIITRYGLHKITGINESVFSQMWKRHQTGKDFYSFFTEDGKVNIDDPGFIKKYYSKVIPEELQKLKDKKKPKIKPVIKKPVEKKVVKKKVVAKKQVPKKTPKPDPVLPDNDPEPETPKDEELHKLQRDSTIAKCKSEIYKSEKAELELKKSRAEVAEIDTLGKTCIGYLHALNQNILDQPRSFVDKFESALKTGKSKTVLTDILREPIMDSIADAVEAITKEIQRYKRDIKSDNMA